MKNSPFHIDFKLNGNSFLSINELYNYTKALSISTQQFLIDWFSNSNFIEVKTSGSTGIPKLIKLDKKCMINSALATGDFFDLKEKTTALLCMSTDYIAGKMMLVRALELGWELDIVKPESNPLRDINKVYDFSAMVPLQLKHSLADLGKVKKLIVGGGNVSYELEGQIQQVSTEVFATFGMTETITHIAVKKLNHYTAKTSYYDLLPNVSITIDQRNCLVINAPMVSVEEVITNDVIELISEKEFKWLGRYDNVINSGGIKLHPEEIEKKLSKVIIQRFFVAGIPDSILGEKLILIIEGSNETAINFEKIQILSKFEKPKKIYFINKFIETETGKIQRTKTISLL